MIYNSILPYDALYLPTSTIVKNGYGYNWKTVPSSPSLPISYENITSGNYFIRNKGDNGYLNVGYGKDEDATTIHIHGFGNYDSQVYNIRNVSDGYEMMPLCSNTRVVNVYADTVTSGKTVNLYHQTNHSSQHWKFEPVGDGYVIRSVQNPNLCLNTQNGLIVSEYTGNNNQIWHLEKACNITFDANGGSNAPASRRVRAGYSFQIPEEQPTRENYTFLGWSTSSTATSVSYQPGTSYTANANLTLYAVWKKDETKIGSGTFWIDNVSGKPGEFVDVVVSVSATDRIESCNLELHYDNSILQVESVEECNLGYGYYEALSEVNYDEPGVIKYGYVCLGATAKEGNFLSIRFLVNETAPAGQSILSLVSADIGNLNDTLFELTLIYGSVAVTDIAAERVTEKINALPS